MTHADFALLCGVHDTDQPVGRPQQPQDGSPWPPQYLGFFECFNLGHYYEAHEVLEALWLTKRQDADGRFYQGLIQLAGAFVHLGKGRPSPAKALLHRAQHHLSAYPARHQGVAVTEVRDLIARWLARIEVAPDAGLKGEAPRLELRDPRR